LSLAGGSGVARLNSSYYGPSAQLRLPLDDRSAFILAGSIGGIRVGLLNQRADIGDAFDLTGDGRYWAAGGGVDLRIAPKTTIDVTVRYQSSTFRTGQKTHLVSSGLLLGVGVSLYVF